MLGLSAGNDPAMTKQKTTLYVRTQTAICDVYMPHGPRRQSSQQIRVYLIQHCT